MSITDDDRAVLTDRELEALAAGVRTSSPGPHPSTPFDLSGPGRVLLATLSAAAGAIHLAMVPSHAAEWLPEGVAFAVAGWVQVALAIVLVARPSRAALRISCLANVAFIAAWVVARVTGLPFGPEAFVPHAAGFVDVTAVVLEVVLVVAGYELLVHPRWGSRAPSSTLVIASIVPVAVLAVTTAAIVSPSAVAHGSGAGAAADGHSHGHDEAAPVDDKGLSLLMNGQGEGGGHTHDTSLVALDPGTQQLLDDQLAQTRPLIDRYPTVAAAEAAGWHRAGPYSPGLGAHYVNNTVSRAPGGVLADDDLEHPTLIYDGIEPTAKLAGFMYQILSLDTQNPPEGFVGPNDHWHYHTNVCLTVRPDGGTDAPLGADQSATKELCDKYNGRLIPNTGYMVHVWTVPGYESPQGVFSNVNAKLTCPNGTYYTVPLEEIGTRTNVCRDVA